MSWIFFAMMAPFLFAVSTFIDKFVLDRYFKLGSNALVAYTGLVGIPAVVLIFIFKPGVVNVSPSTALFVVLNSFLFVGYLFPYYAAIKRADASTVVPIFQIIPVFNYGLAYLVLKETLAPAQIGASLLVILGALGISFDFGTKVHLRRDVLGLMLFASFIISVNITLFKFFAIELDFWTVSFWQYLGFFIFSIALIAFSHRIRTQFVASFSENKAAIIGLNVFNELINLAAVIVFTYATMLAPLALVSLVNGLGPVFVFLIGLLLSVFFPRVIKEDLGRAAVIRKTLSISLILCGVYLLTRTFRW
jgi:uncharacterized membrane protein